MIAPSLFCSEELDYTRGSGAGKEHTNPGVGGCVPWAIGIHGKAQVENEETDAVVGRKERARICERRGLKDLILQFTEEGGTIYRLDGNWEPPSQIFKVERIPESEPCPRVGFQKKE